MSNYGMKVILVESGEHIFTLDCKPGKGETLWCNGSSYRILHITDRPRRCFVEVIK